MSWKTQKSAKNAKKKKKPVQKEAKQVKEKQVLEEEVLGEKIRLVSSFSIDSMWEEKVLKTLKESEKKELDCRSIYAAYEDILCFGASFRDDYSKKSHLMFVKLNKKSGNPLFLETRYCYASPVQLQIWKQCGRVFFSTGLASMLIDFCTSFIFIAI